MKKVWALLMMALSSPAEESFPESAFDADIVIHFGS